MKRRDRQQWKGLLPSSGELLGGLACILDWQPKSSAKERTWRKFCHGEHIHEKTREAILREMVTHCVRALGASRNLAGEPLSPEVAVEALSQVVLVHAVWWDELRTRLQAALPAKPTAFTTAAALRLAVVELATRLGALFVVHGVRLEPPSGAPEQKADIERLLLPWVLRQVLKEAGITRVALAEALDVSKEAVDQWLKSGAVIRPELLDDIAELVAEKMGGNPLALAMGLRALRQTTRVLLPLADAVGKEELSQLFVELVRLTAVACATVEKHLSTLDSEARAGVLGLLVVLGADSPLGEAVQKAMLGQASDASWEGAISTPPSQWGSFLSQVFVAEMLLSRMKGFLEAQGFASMEQDARQLHQWLLLRRETLPFPLPLLLALPRDEGLGACVAAMMLRFQKLGEREMRPDVLREVGLLAESCDVLASLLDDRLTGLREEVEALHWRCRALFILGCMEVGQQLLEQGLHTEALEWARRIEKTLRTLPAFPEAPSSKVGPLLGFFRYLLRALEDLDAGKLPRERPRDLDFLEELRRQQEA